MAKATPKSPLRPVLSKYRVTPDQVADALGVPLSKVAEWQRSLDGAKPSEIRDLAVLLDIATEVLQGTQSEPDSGQGLLVGRYAALYGSLKIAVAGHELDYPVDVTTRASVLNQIADVELQSEGDKDLWIRFESLNNKIVFLSLAAIRQIELVSEAAEATMPFHHQEIYAALDDLGVVEDEDLDIGPLVRSRCADILDDEGDTDPVTGCDEESAALRGARYTRIIGTSGEVSWHFLVEAEDTTGFYALELQCDFPMMENRLLAVASEGYDRVRFVNLSHVAVIEVPAYRYYHLLEEDAQENSPA